MDQMLLEIAKQVPSLGVLCFIVWTFIGYLSKRDGMLKEMHEEHMQSRNSMDETMRENMDVTVKNSQAILALKEAIERLAKGNGNSHS